MKKFKSYEIIEKYPQDGWLKGYFYAKRDDIKDNGEEASRAYRDLAYIGHKDFILHLLEIRPGEKVLDIGCADGAMMVYCGLLGAQVYGIDISKENIEKANSYVARFGIKGKAILSDAKKNNFPDNYFDRVVSSDFCEHLPGDDNIEVFQEVSRVLKPGGIFVVKTPNLSYLRVSRIFKQFKRLLKFKNPFKVIIPHTTGDSPEHIGLLRQKDLIKIIKAAGFLNYQFHYRRNSKLERANFSLAEWASTMPFFKDIFNEELIVVIYKPIILSLFPD